MLRRRYVPGPWSLLVLAQSILCRCQGDERLSTLFVGNRLGDGELSDGRRDCLGIAKFPSESAGCPASSLTLVANFGPLLEHGQGPTSTHNSRQPYVLSANKIMQGVLKVEIILSRF